VIFILILIAEVVLFFSFLRKNRRQTVVSIWCVWQRMQWCYWWEDLYPCHWTDLDLPLPLTYLSHSLVLGLTSTAQMPSACPWTDLAVPSTGLCTFLAVPWPWPALYMRLWLPLCLTWPRPALVMPLPLLFPSRALQLP
jgi:hypothetical protein